MSKPITVRHGSTVAHVRSHTEAAARILQLNCANVHPAHDAAPGPMNDDAMKIARQCLDELVDASDISGRAAKNFCTAF